ncbi:MAG: hypothetical protein KC464_18580 [Myxococcales bacterium]|nr:hypothetical protein [Myxococcales bacterium]
MPSPVTSELPKPKSEDEFEDIAADVAARWWAANVHRNGRRGQRQNGVDLYATPRHATPRHAIWVARE